MNIISFLDGASPWWWIALAFGLGVIELATFSFFLIWPGLAALTLGLLLWIAPGMAGTTQLILFAVLSILFTLGGRWLVLSRKPTSDLPGLNNRAAQLVGRNAVVVDGFKAGGTGNVEVDGIRWRARMAEDGAQPAPGTLLTIASTDGMTLLLATAS
ncbi:MAG: NfeD family protein [Paracoccaceae bacterium]